MHYLGNIRDFDLAIAATDSAPSPIMRYWNKSNSDHALDGFFHLPRTNGTSTNRPIMCKMSRKTQKMNIYWKIVFSHPSWKPCHLGLLIVKRWSVVVACTDDNVKPYSHHPFNQRVTERHNVLDSWPLDLSEKQLGEERWVVNTLNPVLHPLNICIQSAKRRRVSSRHLPDSLHFNTAQRLTYELQPTTASQRIELFILVALAQLLRAHPQHAVQTRSEWCPSISRTTVILITSRWQPSLWSAVLAFAFLQSGAACARQMAQRIPSDRWGEGKAGMQSLRPHPLPVV